ncbi:hypothetical protein GCM10010172_05900 [Paractinoplanes ferrugineus]|uniref:Uncharacterized protein n=1 Tax=Paractinoplanes ferrugineus TaxID=113564 RepID=A0A919J3W2_9ACTN|nr:hypothetical protein Afe05nite_43330 [Actinoplanes ferrugineus]
MLSGIARRSRSRVLADNFTAPASEEPATAGTCAAFAFGASGFCITVRNIIGNQPRPASPALHIPTARARHVTARSLTFHGATADAWWRSY